MPQNSRTTYRINIFILLTLLCLSFAFVFPAEGIEVGDGETQLTQVPVMPEMLVEADRITPTTGTTILDKEIIENLPTRDGNVNELIGIVPGVQYGEGAVDSFMAGEISPPAVSVTGSRFYENNYTIDGMSNNSPLDPASDAYADANKLPGHPQIHFLNPQIIEQITIYNSNIPAEFGGFTGGQVNVKTIEPANKFGGQIKYRMTNDSWTKFHIDPQQEDEFSNSNKTTAQPEFKKQHVSIALETPLSLDTGLVISYHQALSQIPLRHLDGYKKQSRKQENLFLKLLHYLPDNSKLSLTALSSPTTSEYFLTDVKNSQYDLKNNNNSLILQYDKNLDLGSLNLIFACTDQRSKRHAAKDRFYWNPTTPSIDWESGREGSLGEIAIGQDQLNTGVDLSLREFQLGQTTHQVKFGIEASTSRQNYKRPQTSYYYYSPTLDSSISCVPGDMSCIDNEQYFSRRAVYNEVDVTAEVFDSATFIQDVISWKRLEFFPGLRLSYDDFTEEKNYAPRLSLSLDLFGNRQTILYASKNRYYSGTLLTQSLYQPIITENQSRTSYTDEWTSTISYRYQDGAVKTPFADEQTIGIIQKAMGGELKIQYLNKTSKNELARERINNPYPETDVYLLNNLGRSEHESLMVSWQRSWIKHYLEMNATWQDTTTSNTDYDTTLDEEDLLETVWYEGEELLTHEIPRRDFNRPFIINLIYSWQLPYDVTFTNITRYRGAYWRLWNTLERKPSLINPEQTPDPYIYEKRKTKRALTFDWHLTWNLSNKVDRNFVLSVDVLNVFNKRTKVAYQTGTSGYDYELGRQIWAGMEFNF